MYALESNVISGLILRYITSPAGCKKGELSRLILRDSMSPSINSSDLTDGKNRASWGTRGSERGKHMTNGTAKVPCWLKNYIINML